MVRVERSGGRKLGFEEEELLCADSALIIHSDVVTLGEMTGGSGSVRHMHLVYVSRQLEVGVVSGGIRAGQAEKMMIYNKRGERVTQWAPCRGRFPARHGRASPRRTGS